MVTHLEKIETKKYSLHSMEIDVLKKSIKIMELLRAERFATSEYCPSFDGVIEVLNVVIENNNRKFWKNDETEEFEIKTED